jgi:hypothetical protein
LRAALGDDPSAADPDLFAVSLSAGEFDVYHRDVDPGWTATRWAAS